jgi:phosphate transport system substrate-binding protein
MNKRSLLVGLATLLLTSPFSSDPLHAAETKSIKIHGATTLQTVITTMGGEFGRSRKVSVSVEGGGTGHGIKCVKDGSCDVGMVSRALEDAEKEGVVETQIGWDSLSFVVNNTNSVNDISEEQVKGILTGKIVNWKELGGKDEPIHVLSRGPDAASTKELSEKFGIKILGEEVPVNEAVLNRISADSSAFSFVSLGWAVKMFNEKKFKPLNYQGVAATTKNLLNGSYPFKRPLILIVSKEKGRDPIIKSFVAYVVKNRRKYLIENGYTPSK